MNHICEENKTGLEILKRADFFYILRVENIIEYPTNIYIDYCPWCGKKL